MAQTPEQALKALTAPGSEPAKFRHLVVSAVRDDGTVNLALGNQVITAVPALASYTPRTVGDKVVALQTEAGWLVLGHAGAESVPVPPEPTVPLIKTERFAAAESGFSLPSATWRTLFDGHNIVAPVGFPYLTLSATVSVRARNTTAGQDYIQLTIDPIAGYDAITDIAPGYVGTATGPLDVDLGPFDAGDLITLAATARAGIAAWSADAFNAAHVSGVALWRSAPSPAVVTPTTDAAYRFGSSTDDANPIQGGKDTDPAAWSGAWFYGTSIKDACDAGNVDHITMSLTRSGRRHGQWGGATPRLFLHAATSKSTRAPALFNPSPGPVLELGQTTSFRLPDDWITALASGAARGIGCAADRGSDYLIYGACGALTIHFK